MRYIFLLILLFPILTKADELNIHSKSYIVLENSTNTIIGEKSSHERMPIASLTKVMTLYILFDFLEKNNISEDTIVPISTNAVSTARITNSSRSFLEERHQVYIIDIIKSLVIHSGNDAAIAISEFISGTEDNFVELMNDFAIKLEMHNTLYANASGLPTPHKEQYSTAYDQAILNYRLINDFKDLYDRFFHQRSFTYNNIFQQSRNRLLFIDPQFDGIKTGWTREAGYSYSTSIYKDGRRLIIVTLNAEKPEYRFQDALKLSDYAFSNYSNFIFAKSQSKIQGIDQIPIFRSDKLFAGIYNDKDLMLTVNNKYIKNIKVEINIPEKLNAPVYKDQKVGNIKLLLNNELVGESNLMADNNYPIGSIKSYLIDSFLMSMK